MKYQKKLSGPLIDRIDLHVHVQPVHDKDLIEAHRSESSEIIKTRIIAARKVQTKRFMGTPVQTNGEMSSVHVRSLCKLSPDAVTLLKAAIARLSLSARSYFKIIKVAQTIADLGDSSTIEGAHVAEALQYRPQERSGGI